MELRDYIAKGAKLVGSQRELAERIGIAERTISDAKANRRGLPNITCGKLAEITGDDAFQIVAASNLITEKDETTRNEWLRLLKKLGGIAASFMLAAFLTVTLIVTSPTQALAASGLQTDGNHAIQIMRTCTDRRKLDFPVSPRFYSPPK